MTEPHAIRVRRLESIAEIRELQYEFGYRLAAGDAAGAAELFSPDGIVEVSGDGGVRGPAPITARLTALVAPGGSDDVVPRLPMVRAHLQIMPVITVAPDDVRAQATWRDLDTGGGPVPAYWAEGPLEVTYTRTELGWRIARLHWLPYVHVPYDGGWEEHAAASSAGTPAQWPEVFHPPFHFLEPDPPATTSANADAAEADLAERVQVLEDQRAIENAIGMLGFYLDKEQWTRAGGLFASGTAAGLPLWPANTVDGPSDGVLRDTMFAQISATVSGNRAHARWRAFAQWARHGEGHEWGLATLTAELVRTVVGWRIAQVDVPFAVFTPYDEGWSRIQSPTSTVFTGEGSGAAYDGGTAQAVDPESRDDLDLRLRRLEASAEIERTQNIYGYYLATFEWDRLADLFTEDGVIEVALRGIYRGRDSVRRSLDLYGTHAERGVLHNHMQLQPVIHVDDDARRATLRARSFSMMGQFGESSRWAGGIYDNVYVATPDGWRVAADRMINTYFAPYATGWKDLPPRDAPGINPKLPPDEGPSDRFVMYPGAQPPAYPYRDPQKPPRQ